MVALYLSHVRASLVSLVAMIAVYATMLVFQKERARLVMFAGVTAAVFSIAFAVAIAAGGDSTYARFSPLFQEDPRELYYRSRGVQVEHGFQTLLFEHPLGAGLGRWGMVHNYFGDWRNSHNSDDIWVEVQPVAWIVDGGFLLLVIYGLALLVTLRQEWRLASRTSSAEFRACVAAVAAVNVGTLALTLSFTPFATQIGLQYWFLAGALHGAAQGEFAARRNRRRSGADFHAPLVARFG